MPRIVVECWTCRRGPGTPISVCLLDFGVETLTEETPLELGELEIVAHRAAGHDVRERKGE